MKIKVAGRARLVHTGPRGGQYVLIKGRKKYIGTPYAQNIFESPGFWVKRADQDKIALKESILKVVNTVDAFRNNKNDVAKELLRKPLLLRIVRPRYESFPLYVTNTKDVFEALKRFQNDQNMRTLQIEDVKYLGKQKPPKNLFSVNGGPSAKGETVEIKFN